jgi:hypothetical protein
VNIRQVLLAGTAALAVAHASAAGAERPLASAAAPPGAVAGKAIMPRIVDFGREPVSADAQYVADWIAETRDNDGMDFVIIDKKFARVYVFDRSARVRGSSVILLGAMKGDHTVPGVGAKALEQVRQDEKTTPAGRFVAQRGINARGEDVVWVDYEAGVSMHRVITTNPQERRLQRLASKSLEDKRISYGCINVPVKFFEQVIAPVFVERQALVYVLPEVKSVHEVFGPNAGSGPRAQKVSTH